LKVVRVVARLVLIAVMEQMVVVMFALQALLQVVCSSCIACSLGKRHAIELAVNLGLHPARCASELLGKLETGLRLP